MRTIEQLLSHIDNWNLIMKETDQEYGREKFRAIAGKRKGKKKRRKQ